MTRCVVCVKTEESLSVGSRHPPGGRTGVGSKCSDIPRRNGTIHDSGFDSRLRGSPLALIRRNFGTQPYINQCAVPRSPRGGGRGWGKNGPNGGGARQRKIKLVRVSEGTFRARFFYAFLCEIRVLVWFLYLCKGFPRSILKVLS